MECGKVRRRKEPILDDRAQNVTKCSSSHGKTLGEMILTEGLIELCHDSRRDVCSGPQLAVSFRRKHNRTGRERELRGGKGPMWRGVNLGSIGSDNSRMDWNRQGRGNCSRTRRYYLPPRSSK